MEFWGFEEEDRACGGRWEKQRKVEKQGKGRKMRKRETGDERKEGRKEGKKERKKELEEIKVKSQ